MVEGCSLGHGEPLRPSECQTIEKREADKENRAEDAIAVEGCANVMEKEPGENFGHHAKDGVMPSKLKGQCDEEVHLIVPRQRAAYSSDIASS